MIAKERKKEIVCKKESRGVGGRGRIEKCYVSKNHRYSAPQSPIEVIMVRVLERFKTTSIAAMSCIVKWKPYTSWFSSGCSDRPSRAPVFIREREREKKS